MSRAECPGCGRLVTTFVPQGGDGSAEVFRRHKGSAGSPCPKSRSFVPDENYRDSAEKREGDTR